MRHPYQKLFLVCTGERCNNPDRGDERGEIIRDELKAHNKSLGRKATIRVCAVSCLDLCEHGPNMVVEPGETWYSHLTRAAARRVYDEETGDAP
jgi:(2Fe-2S) ferredoxin